MINLLEISRPTETYRYPGDKVSEASVSSQLLPVTGHGYRITLRIRTNHVAKVLRYVREILTVKYMIIKYHANYTKCYRSEKQLGIC